MRCSGWIVPVLFLPVVAYAQDTIDTTLSATASFNTPRAVETNREYYYKYRALFFERYHLESGSLLVIEKLYVSDSEFYGDKPAEPAVQWQQAVQLSDIEGLSSELGKLSAEGSLSCCHISDLAWQDSQLHFTAHIPFSDHRFSCHSSDVTVTPLEFECSPAVMP